MDYGLLSKRLLYLYRSLSILGNDYYINKVLKVDYYINRVLYLLNKNINISLPRYKSISITGFI